MPRNLDPSRRFWLRKTGLVLLILGGFFSFSAQHAGHLDWVRWGSVALGAVSTVVALICLSIGWLTSDAKASDVNSDHDPQRGETHGS